MKPQVLLSILGLWSCCAHAGELGLNVYGLSYHLEGSRAKEAGLDNSINPGVGVRYLIGETQSLRWFGEIGLYRDSGGHTAEVAGAALQWKATASLGVGVALALFNSPAYNEGRAFVAPLPVVSYDWKAITLNLFYAPRLSALNDINTVGLWVTVWPARFR